MNSYWVPHAGSENHCETTKSLKSCYLFNINQESVYRIKISDVDELKRHSNTSWTLWVTRLLSVLLASGISVYALAFMLEADILSTWCNKDDVMWHVVTYLRDTETVTASHLSHVCRYSVNHSNVHCIIVLTAQSDTLHISQGTAGTYLRWSGHFRHSFVQGLFRDSLSNF